MSRRGRLLPPRVGANRRSDRAVTEHSTHDLIAPRVAVQVQLGVEMAEKVDINRKPGMRVNGTTNLPGEDMLPLGSTASAGE